jgi:hypothetical protein
VLKNAVFCKHSRSSSSKSVPGEEGHPVGTRLTVRYGKGNNQKTYEAKVKGIYKFAFVLETIIVQWLVHFQL